MKAQVEVRNEIIVEILICMQLLQLQTTSYVSAMMSLDAALGALAAGSKNAK